MGTEIIKGLVQFLKGMCLTLAGCTSIAFIIHLKDCNNDKLQGDIYTIQTLKEGCGTYMTAICNKHTKKCICYNILGKEVKCP